MTFSSHTHNADGVRNAVSTSSVLWYFIFVLEQQAACDRAGHIMDACMDTECAFVCGSHSQGHCHNVAMHQLRSNMQLDVAHQIVRLIYGNLSLKLGSFSIAVTHSHISMFVSWSSRAQCVAGYLGPTSTELTVCQAAFRSGLHSGM